MLDNHKRRWKQTQLWALNAESPPKLTKTHPSRKPTETAAQRKAKGRAVR